MKKIMLIYLIMISLFAPINYAQNSDFQIKNTGGRLSLVLSDKIKRAIAEVVQNFKPWQLSDYLPSISENFTDINESITPFAVISDINRDGIKDLVVDGTDGDDNITLVVLSGKTGFKAAVIEQLYIDKSDTTKVIEDGEIVKGFNRFLGFNNYLKKRDKTYAFDIMFKQIETTDGGLSDPGSITYYFRDNELVQENQEY